MTGTHDMDEESTTGALLLDAATWDLVIDAQGNIAQAAAPYAIV